MRKYTRQEIDSMNANDLFKLGKNELAVPGISMMGDDEIKNAVLAHLSQKGLIVEAADGGQAAAAAAAPIPAQVYAAYPPYETTGNFAGKSVAEIFRQLQQAWSMGDDTRGFVNGKEMSVTSQQILQPGDRMEFAKPAGAKGG